MKFFHTRPGRAAKRMVAASLRAFLRVFYFLPINSRRILFCERGGRQYAGNVKCVSDHLQAQYGDQLELVWAFQHPAAFRDVPGIKTVRFRSPLWFYYVLTASVMVTDAGNSRACPKRNGQFFLDVWHGGGAYKRVAIRRPKISEAEGRSFEQLMQALDLCVSSSRLFTQYNLREDRCYKGEVLNSGMPRNDIFFSAERQERAAEKVRRAFGLEGYVVLYAPTFRGMTCQDYQIDYGFPYEAVLTALRERFDGPVTILKRAHLGCVMADLSPAEVLDVSDWPDMQELLCAADMLITDYSSSMWDYALTGRPCLLYMKDLEIYKRERGICTPVEQWPGIACRSDDELTAAIRSLDEDVCREKAREHLRSFGSYETGTATEQVCERIMAHIEKCRAGNRAV